MNAIIWIAVIIAVYFFLKLFDPKKKEKPHRSESSDIRIKATVSGGSPSDSYCNPNAKVQRLQYFCIKDKGYHVSVWPRDQYITDYVEFEIAGMSYRDNIDEYLGEHVGTLEAEPTNEYDHNAIKILAEDGHHVGYVPKNMTAAVREFTTIPCTCYFYIGDNDGIYYSDAYINRE